MAVLTGAQIIAQAQLLAQDTDPDAQNQGLTVAQWLSVTNESYYDMYEIINPQGIQYDSSLIPSQPVGASSGTAYNVATTKPVALGGTQTLDLVAVEFFAGSQTLQIVTGCSGASGQKVITSIAGAFSAITVGSVITNPSNLAAGAVVSVLADGSSITMTNNLANAAPSSITLMLGVPSITEGTGTVLERMDVEEIRFLQSKKGTTAAAPVFAGWTRQEGTGKFLIWLYPIVVTSLNQWALAGYVNRQPTALAGSTEFPDLQDAESYDLARLAAARGSVLIGDNDLADRIAGELPPKFQQLYAKLGRAKRPRPETSEPAV